MISEKNESLLISRVISDLPQINLDILNKSEAYFKGTYNENMKSSMHNLISLRPPRKKFQSSNLMQKGVLHLKELSQSDVCLDDLVADIDEDIANDVYEFNINSSRLHKDKHHSVSPMRRDFTFFG